MPTETGENKDKRFSFDLTDAMRSYALNFAPKASCSCCCSFYSRSCTELQPGPGPGHGHGPGQGSGSGTGPGLCRGERHMAIRKVIAAELHY